MSSHFILTKPHLGAAYSSGNKMPLGKLDSRLGSVRLNSASGTGIRLYDKNYGNFETVGLGLYASPVDVPAVAQTQWDADGLVSLLWQRSATA